MSYTVFYNTLLTHVQKEQNIVIFLTEFIHPYYYDVWHSVVWPFQSVFYICLLFSCWGDPATVSNSQNGQSNSNRQSILERLDAICRLLLFDVDQMEYRDENSGAKGGRDLGMTCWWFLNFFTLLTNIYSIKIFCIL